MLATASTGMAQRNASVDVSRLPEHMQNPARAYVERGRMPGGFLYAVLCNDFTDAVGRADATNAEALDDWAKWLFNDIPPLRGATKKLSRNG